MLFILLFLISFRTKTSPRLDFTASAASRLRSHPNGPDLARWECPSEIAHWLSGFPALLSYPSRVGAIGFRAIRKRRLECPHCWGTFAVGLTLPLCLQCALDSPPIPGRNLVSPLASASEGPSGEWVSPIMPRSQDLSIVGSVC